jgi:hypothetical protein
MKIKIAMEAEITDLKSYFPDVPKGISIQNVGSHLRDVLHSDQLMKLIVLSSKEHTEVVCLALKKHYQDDIALGKRLTDHMNITLED